MAQKFRCLYNFNFVEARQSSTISTLFVTLFIMNANNVCDDRATKAAENKENNSTGNADKTSNTAENGCSLGMVTRAAGRGSIIGAAAGFTLELRSGFLTWKAFPNSMAWGALAFGSALGIYEATKCKLLQIRVMDDLSSSSIAGSLGTGVGGILFGAFPWTRPNSTKMYQEKFQEKLSDSATSWLDWLDMNRLTATRRMRVLEYRVANFPKVARIIELPDHVPEIIVEGYADVDSVWRGCEMHFRRDGVGNCDMTISINAWRFQFAYLVDKENMWAQERIILSAIMYWPLHLPRLVVSCSMIETRTKRRAQELLPSDNLSDACGHFPLNLIVLDYMEGFRTQRSRNLPLRFNMIMLQCPCPHR